MQDPITQQEELYRFPYHWFPEERLKKFEREEKQRIVFSLINKYKRNELANYLDVGCGDGRWTNDIHYHISVNLSSVGIDFSERAIGFASLISPSIDFRVHRGEDIPFPDGSFDLVTAIEVIEHVEDGAEGGFLSEIHRVLHPEGLLILTTPSWNLRLSRHHFRHYSIERLEALLQQNDFSVLDIRGQSIPCYGLKRRIRKRMNLFPMIWKLWRFSYRETLPEKSLNLVVSAQPISRSV